MVVFSDFRHSPRANFPTLADVKGASYVAQLAEAGDHDAQHDLARSGGASMKVNGVMPPSFPVKNEPPRIIVSNTPAILVPDRRCSPNAGGAGDSGVSRVINTHALILQGGLGDDFYIRCLRRLDDCENSRRAVGRQARRTPCGFDDVAKKLARPAAPSTCSTAAPMRIRSRA